MYGSPDESGRSGRLHRQGGGCMNLEFKQRQVFRREEEEEVKAHSQNLGQDGNVV